MRIAFLVTAVIVTVVVLIGTATAALWGWASYSQPPEQLAAVGDVFTEGTLILAAVAAVVALAAYLVSIQHPKLIYLITFPQCDSNRPLLPYVPPGPGANKCALQSPQGLIATVTIRNLKSFSARNPALKITFKGLMGVGSQPKGWRVVERGPTGAIHVIQWNGGADRSIHWEQDLPSIDLAGSWFLADSPPQLLIEVAAEGWRTAEPMPIDVLTEPEWLDRLTAER